MVTGTDTDQNIQQVKQEIEIQKRLNEKDNILISHVNTIDTIDTINMTNTACPACGSNDRAVYLHEQYATTQQA